MITRLRKTFSLSLLILSAVCAVASTAEAQQPVNVSAIGGLQPVIARCDDPAKVESVPIDDAGSGWAELVALVSNERIYVCGFNFASSGTVNVKLGYGTGTNCGTGTTDLTGAYPATAQWGMVIPNTGLGIQLKTALSNALCINLSGAVGVFGFVTYVQE